MMDLIRPTSENKSQLTPSRKYPPETELLLEAKLEVYNELHEDGVCFYCGQTDQVDLDDECIDFCSKPYPMVNQVYWQKTFASTSIVSATTKNRVEDYYANNENHKCSQMIQSAMEEVT